MLDAIGMAVIVVATLTIAIVTLANAWILLSKEVAEFLSTKATTFATMKTITTEETVAVILMIRTVTFANAWILPSNVSILTTIPIVQTGLLLDIAPSRFTPTG